MRFIISIVAFICCLCSMVTAVASAQKSAIICCDPKSDQKISIPVFAEPSRPWVIENLACNQTIVALATERGYTRVQIGQKVGYVDAKYVCPLQSNPELEKRVADLEKQIRGQQQPQTAEPTVHPAPASQPAEKSEGTQVTTTPDSEVRVSASAIWIRLSSSKAELQRRRSNEIEMATERAATERAATGGARMPEIGKYDRLLADLRSASASRREDAVKVLANSGAKMNETQTRRLIEIMRHGSEQWETGSYRPPGHHCTDYEYTTVRYYAGRALQQMKSPYVDMPVKNEASRAENEGRTTKRVTDPGWV